MLVLQSETDDQPEPKPRARRRAVNNADQKVNRAGPEQWFVNVGRIEIASGQEEQTPKHPGASQRDRPKPAAQLPRKYSGKTGRKRARNCRKNAHGKERAAEQDHFNSQEPCTEGCEIDVTPVQVASAGDEIKFIAKVAVAAIGKQMNG